MTAARRHLLVALLVVLAGCSGLAPQTTPTDAQMGTATVPSTDAPSPAETASASTATATPPTPESAADPDGDGFTNCEERELLDDADPDRMDVYVEIDWTAGARPNVEEVRELVALYDDAPVENPGEDGIALHLVFDDRLPARDRPLDTGNFSAYTEYFDNEGRGYRHAVFVETIENNPLGRGDPESILVQRVIPNGSQGLHVNVFAHELGHSLGLTRQVFEGVDNFTMPYERYPSVMSYHGLRETRSLSDGTAGPSDFDDWGYLDANLTVPDTDRLEDAPAC